MAVLRSPTAVDRMADAIRALLAECGAVEADWKPWKPRRSDEQNRYLWGVCYRTIADHTGHSVDEWHEYFLGEHFGWETVDMMGRKKLRPLRRSRKLKKSEFADFIAFVQQRAAENGIFIPEAQ